MSDEKTPHMMETVHVEDAAVRDGIQIEDPHAVASDTSTVVAHRPSWTTLLAIFSLALSTGAAIMVPAVLVPGILFEIGAALGDVGSSLWLLNAWAVPSGLTAVLAGHLSDIFGRRYVILIGEALSIIGSIIGATAHSIGAGLAGMVFLGLSAGIILSVWSAVPELVPFRWRGLSLSFVEFVLCVPWVSFSVLLGRLLLVHASWRWCFIIGIIYGTLAFTGTALFYWPPSRNRHDHSKTRWQQIADLDYVGLILWTAGFTIFLIGLAWGGTNGHAWDSVSVIAPIILGACTLVACFLYDFYAIPSEKALFPLSLFRRCREYTLVLVGTFVGGMIYYPMSGLLPQGTLYLFTNKPTRIGLLSLPNGIAQTLGPLIYPTIMHFTKRPKYNLMAILTLQGVFTAAMAYGAEGHVAAWAGLQIFVQGCFTSIVIASTVNTSLHISHSQLGLAIGVLAAFRSAGGSLGVAILGTILNSAAEQRVGPSISKAALELNYPAADLPALIPAVYAYVTGTPDAFAGVPGITPAIVEATVHAFRHSYGQAFKVVFYSTIPFSVLAVIAVSFVRDSSQYLTNHTAVVMERNSTGKKNGAATISPLETLGEDKSHS